SIFTVMQSVLRLPVYYVIVMSWLTCCYMMEIFIATVIDYVIDKGASQSDAVSVMSYSSLADLLGRALLPLLADCNVLRRSTLTACNFFVMGAAVTCMPVAASYGAIVAVTFAASCSGGCAMCMCGVLLADNVGLDQLEISYGLMGMIVAPLFLVRPLFVGFFRDKLGTYDDMYHVLAGLIFFTSLLWCLVACTEQRTSKRYVL
ncbi:monocarboxylate transporter, putative, partial [Ixodes scapularis]